MKLGTQYTQGYPKELATPQDVDIYPQLSKGSYAPLEVDLCGYRYVPGTLFSCQQRTIAESRYGRGMIKVGVGMNSLSMDTRCAACWLGLVVSICRSVKGPDLVILFVGPGHTKSLR